MSKKCKNCKKVLKVEYLCRLKNKKYCSHECYVKHRITGKSLEKIFGKVKADKIKFDFSIRNSKPLKERFDSKTAKMLKDNLYKAATKVHKFRKNKTYEEIYGDVAANKIKSKISIGNSGTFEEKFGKKKSDDIKNKLSIVMKEFKQSGKFNIRPTLLELKLVGIFKKYKLPFTFVGNGKLWIENINPDFVNEELKIIVEVYSLYWKNKVYGSEKNYKRIRKRICNRYGYRVVFINENEINNEKLVLRKINFIEPIVQKYEL